jgi:hypothetical protein
LLAARDGGTTHIINHNFDAEELYWTITTVRTTILDVGQTSNVNFNSIKPVRIEF